MPFADPFYLLLLIPLAAGLWFSFGHVHGMMRSRKWLAFAVRGVLAAALILALAGPEARRPNEGVCAIFLLDRSDSVSEANQRKAIEFISQALKALGPKDQASVIAFGGDAVIDAAPGPLRRLDRVLSVVDGSATDLAGAIRLASAAFPEGKARRIVVLSDGNETTGDAVEAAKVAATDRIQIDTVPLNVEERKQEVTVVDVQTPSETRIGQPIEIRVVADSMKETRGVLALDRDGITIRETPVTLLPGKNSLVLTDTIESPGFHRYRATLELEDDTDRRNNIGMGFVEVRGRPRVLVLQEEASPSLLADALRRQDLDVRVYGPEGVPSLPEEIRNYDLVVFNEINAASMSRAQMRLVRAAVRDSGIGFVMIGGENSFLPGGYYGTPIAEALPVNLDIRQCKTFPSTSILVVVDASGSMAMIEGGAPKIRLAARGAEEIVKMMAPQDRVGVAGSTDGIMFVTPMQIARDKNRVISQVRKLSTGGGGIYVRPSMEFAQRTLRAEASKVRHLILLADGADCDQTEGCIAIASSMRSEKITTSVVAIGDGKDVPFLRQLAAAGGGQFYLTNSAGRLPAIFTQDASLMSRSAIEEGVFLPKVLAGAEALRGIPPDRVPALYAYCLADDRPLATVSMRTAKDDPLLASWQYGLGSSLAFTSDAQARWAARWVTWDGFGRFWAQAARSVTRRAAANRYQIAVNHDGSSGVVEVEAFDSAGNPLNAAAADARVSMPDGTSRDLALTQTAPGKYRDEFEASELGTYIVTVAEDAPGGTKRVASSGFALPYPPEYRRYRANLPLLARIGELTGGTALPSPREAFRPIENPGHSVTRLWMLFLLAGAVVLPFDVATRRIAIPIGEALRRAVQWLRERRSEAAKPPREAEAVGRLAQAKARVARDTPDEKPAPRIITPNAGAPPPEPSAPASAPSSAAERLLEAKRRRKAKSE